MALNKGIILLFTPGFLWYIIFKYVPLLGLTYAFTEFGRAADVSFVGLENFIRLLGSPNFVRAFFNTLIISYYLEKISKENKATFGNGKLDCCDLSKKNKR